MAKKKSEIKGDELIGGVLADAPQETKTAELEKIGGWALQGTNGKFVSREGFWVGAGDAARFGTEADANQFNDRECEGLYQAVEI